MFYYEGQACPVCGKAFEETDDIVSCPECGAPHHRACWLAAGHCHFADRHGTPEQWTRPEADTATEEPPVTEPETSEEQPPAQEEEEGRRCPHCGKNNPTYSEFCSRCGRPLVEQDWTPPPYRNPGAAYTPFHAPGVDDTGSVARDALLDADVTAREAAMVVGTNQRYYLPRFEKMRNEDKMVSWNWVAFLFPAPWLFYRKNYVAGSIVLALQVIVVVLLSLLMEPFMVQSETLMQAFASGDLTATQYLSQYQMLVDTHMMKPAVLMLSVLQMVLNIGMGMLGNYIYRCAVMNRCRKLKTEYPSDYEARLPIEGGVTAGLFAMAYFVGEFLPALLLMLFQ